MGSTRTRSAERRSEPARASRRPRRCTGTMWPPSTGRSSTPFPGTSSRSRTESAYAPEDLEIVAKVAGVTPDLVAREPELRIVQEAEAQPTVVMLPRYEAFTLILPR